MSNDDDENAAAMNGESNQQDMLASPPQPSQPEDLLGVAAAAPHTAAPRVDLLGLDTDAPPASDAPTTNGKSDHGDDSVDLLAVVAPDAPDLFAAPPDQQTDLLNGELDSSPVEQPAADDLLQMAPSAPLDPNDQAVMEEAVAEEEPVEAQPYIVEVDQATGEIDEPESQEQAVSSESPEPAQKSIQIEEPHVQEEPPAVSDQPVPHELMAQPEQPTQEHSETQEEDLLVAQEQAAIEPDEPMQENIEIEEEGPELQDEPLSEPDEPMQRNIEIPEEGPELQDEPLSEPDEPTQESIEIPEEGPELQDEPLSEPDEPTQENIEIPEEGPELQDEPLSEPEHPAKETELQDEPLSQPDQSAEDTTKTDVEQQTSESAAETYDAIHGEDTSDDPVSKEGSIREEAPAPDPANESPNESAQDSADMKPPAPVADAAPSWASPEAAADSAPEWASSALSPAVPKVIDETLQRELTATMVELPPIEPTSYESAVQDDTGPDAATQALILDLQASIQEHLDEREAVNERARKAEARVEQLEVVVQAKYQLEKELKETTESLSSAVADREHLLRELDKLREDRDEHERKQIVLSNRLNAAKKQEAAKANLAESLDDNVQVLKHDLEKTKKEFQETTAKKEQLSEQLKTTAEDYEQRLKKVEAHLSEERRLNDDRKKKMKSFVENKQEEVRDAKSQHDELNMELSQTNRSLREHHARWKQLHAQWVQSQTRNRELQRDINRMKKESENMSRRDDQLSVKLSQRAQETETHKNKRLTAKQEIMTVLETLEAEREVSSKLQDSIKFTFTPKALSQQQILKESLRDFEHELTRLSQRLGKPLPPSHDTPAETFALEHDDEDGDIEGGGRRSRSQIDSTHLLSNLEDETQRVSQCIMALTSNIERLHILIAQSGERTCTTLLADLLAGASAASSEEATTMAGPRIGLGTFRSYGQVPTAND